MIKDWHFKILAVCLWSHGIERAWGRGGWVLGNVASFVQLWESQTEDTATKDSNCMNPSIHSGFQNLSHSGRGEKGALLHCWWECKLVQTPWRTVWGFLKTLELELPYDPAIPLLGIHTEETRSERDTCTPVFIAALFIIARTWKQPRCPSADEWIRKLWYIYNMEYYSAIKTNSFESVLMRWMKLEPIIQSEVSQKDKDHYSIQMHMWNLEG